MEQHVEHMSLSCTLTTRRQTLNAAMLELPAGPGGASRVQGGGPSPHQPPHRLVLIAS